MKRSGKLWYKICSILNVTLAADYTINKHKKSAKIYKYYQKHREEIINKIANDLRHETYLFGKMRTFIIYEPKERIIHHPDIIPDQIYYNAILNIIKPILISKLTHFTFSSIKGRGIHKAQRKVFGFISLHKDYWYAKIDIKKFYPNIDHDVLKGQLLRIIKCLKTYNCLCKIIDLHSPGLPIGTPPSQFLANININPVDHYMKEVYRVPFYSRYMDDIVIIAETKKEVIKALEVLTEKITELKLTIKNNVRIDKVSNGINYVGYVIYPTHIRLRKSIKLRMKHKTRNTLKYNSDINDIKLKFASYYGWCKFGNCKHLLETVIGKYILDKFKK